MSSGNEFKPILVEDIGSEHPINQTKNYLLSLLSSYGFTSIEGPEIETEEFNFDMLNIKKTHPARQMHDTFYIDNKSFLLRILLTEASILELQSSGGPRRHFY